jgi:tetratricopeptide (TPR) repeat protein
LRQTLHKLRKSGLAISSVDTTKLSLSALQVRFDYEDFAQGLFDTKPGQTLCVLPGYYADFSSEFSEWVEQRKKEVTAVVTRSLLRKIVDARSDANWAQLEQLSRQILQMSPLNEEATLALAESVAMRGEKIEGVAILKEYLADIGRSENELRLSPAILRRRITEYVPSKPHERLGDVGVIGRANIMRRLQSQLVRLRHGDGGICILRGDAGIGKSRLASEFQSICHLQGVVTCGTRCRETDESRPMAMLLDLIPVLCETRGAIGASPETLRFLNTLSTRRPDSDTLSPILSASGIGSAQVTYALVDLLEALSEESPLLITIEDIHWADGASLHAIGDVAVRLARKPVLFLFTSRRSIEALTQAFREVAETVDVPPLTDSAARELMLGITSQHRPRMSDTYLDWCIRVAEGNPYFLQELSNQWVETGEEHKAPPSLSAVLDQRLDLLSLESMQLLQTCAVLENHASIDNAESVLGYEPHVLLQSINQLAGAGMILLGSADSPSRKQRLINRHDLLSQSAMSRLTPAAKAYLHRRAASVLESSADDTQDASTLWACAKHWQLAGDGEHARRLATSVANHLLSAGLPVDAAEAFQQALDYCVSDVETLSVLEAQVVAYFRASAWQKVSETAAKARALKAALLPDQSKHDDMELMVLRSEWQALNWQDTRDKCYRCLTSLEASVTHRAEAGVMALMLTSFVGDESSGRQIFNLVMEMGQMSDVSPLTLLQARMVFHTNWGDYAEAIVATRELVNRTRSEGNVGELFRCLCNSAVTFRAAGLFTEARTNLLEALELADRHHLHYAKARALPMLANMALELGDTANARRWLDSLIQTPISSEDRFGRAEISAISTRIALLDGNFAEAKRLVDRDLVSLRGDQVPHRRAYSLALAVAVDLAIQRSASKSLVSQLHDAHSLSKSNLFQAFTTFVLYAGLSSIGECESATKILNDYKTIHRREAWPAPMHLLESLSV